MSNSNENRRNFYRLVFPKGEELKATIFGDEYLVREIAEQSIRLTESCISDRDGVCEGSIRWSDGKESHFSGMVDRVLHSKQVIVGVTGIETADIINEQRQLLIRFPQLRSLM